MITKTEQKRAQLEAVHLFDKASLRISEEEKQSVEVVDFGLSHLSVEGAQILSFVQTERIGVKVIALLPYQTLPEHWHPPVGEDAGKEETLRHLYGDFLLYIEGENSLVQGFVPEGGDSCYTCRREINMEPGSQFTLAPGEKHWFQAGKRGAVFFSFSTVARDALDQFSNPDIDRITKIADD